MNVQPQATDLIIRTGTSFGMCVGPACRKDYVLKGTSMTLAQTGALVRGQPGEVKTCETTISATDWANLTAVANLETFKKLPETLGCPDCADGGAEYIELESGDSKHRVTFEYGKTITGFEPLVNALRQKREEFMECK